MGKTNDTCYRENRARCEETDSRRGGCHNLRQNYSLKERIMAFLVIIRPWWLLPLGLIVVSSAVLAVNGIPNGQILILVILSFICGKSGATTMNDFFDRDIDQINFPNRPIPSGIIKPNEALIFSTLLFTCSLILGALVNWIFFSITLSIIALSLLHFGVIKRWSGIPGIATTGTALCVSLIALAGWSAFAEINLLSIFFVLIIFTYDIAHDTSSSIRDYEGDLGRRISTFATALGKEIAARIALLIFILSFVLSLVLMFFTNLGYFYLFLVLSGGLLSIYMCLSLLYNPSQENGRKAHRIISFYAIVLCSGIIIDIIFHLLWG